MQLEMRKKKERGEKEKSKVEMCILKM